MRGTRRPGGSALARLARGWRLDRNPLRRRSDRAETIIAACLLATMIAGGPATAIAGGDFARDLARGEQQHQQATERQVTAVTLVPATPPVTSRFLEENVMAGWNTSRGTLATAQVPVLAGTPAGTHTLVWTSADGKLAAPPLLDAQVRDLGTLGQATSVAALAAMLAAGWALSRRAANRHRYAAWEAEWRLIDHRGSERT